MECKPHLIPRALATPLVIWETKAGPLSFWMDLGSPNRGIISLNRALETSQAISVQVGNASIQPEKVSVKTSKLSKISLCPGHYCKIRLPVLTWICASILGGGHSLDLGWGFVLGLFWRQIGQASTTCLRRLWKLGAVMDLMSHFKKNIYLAVLGLSRGT